MILYFVMTKKEEKIVVDNFYRKIFMNSSLNDIQTVLLANKYYHSYGWYSIEDLCKKDFFAVTSNTR